MAAVLSLLMAYLIFVQTFALDVGLGPGLSLKNGILYALLGFIVLRAMIQREFRLEVKSIFGTFGVLLGYIALSTIVMITVVQYPGYKPMTALMQFKGLPFDFMAFFAVFFLGTRTHRDVQQVLAAILLAVLFGNAVSAVDALGIYHVSTINPGETADRVQGVIGEHNQYGAFLVFFLPQLVAAAIASKGWKRLFWLCGALGTFGLLLMTVSRGAFVGLFGALVIGGFMFRRYLLNPRVLGWVAGSAVVAIIAVVVVLVATPFGATLVERVMGESTSVSVWEASSGRTELWMDALEHMMREPITFITGFGWASYFVLPASLPLAPHNTYLWYFFELGLIGVGAFIALLAQVIATATRAAPQASDTDRILLIGFTIGAVALAISIFFVEIYAPWQYFWPCAGVMMRMAVLSRASHQSPALARPRISEGKPVDKFGWSAAPVSRAARALSQRASM